jgi:CheY-like chemotaxis protein
VNSDSSSAGGDNGTAEVRAPAAKKVVLLVDVHADTRDSRAKVMGNMGVSVHCASSAVGARAKLQTGVYNLVLVDLGRDLDGAESLVHEIRLKYPGQLVAFLVGSPLFVATSLNGHRPRAARVLPAQGAQPVPVVRAANPPPREFDFGQKIKEAEAEDVA